MKLSYIFEDKESVSLLKTLRNYIRGNATKDDIEESDDFISKIVERGFPGDTTIVIDFDNKSDFFEFFNVHDDDIWFAGAVNSPYDTYEFHERYSVREDFYEGYGIWYALEDKNKEKLEEISNIILPGHEFNLNDDNFKKELATKLEDLFREEFNNIIDDYTTERNHEMTITAKESIDGDIDSYLQDIGFKTDQRWHKIFTTVGDLIYLYQKNDGGNLGLKDFLKKVIENSKTLGDWDENRYEFQNDENFDKVSFNLEVEKNLDSIIEKLSPENINEKAFEMVKRIKSKFVFGRWYPLPKNKEVNFKIIGFDLQNQKIKLIIYTQNKENIKASISEEGFNNLLYHPELFDIFK